VNRHNKWLLLQYAFETLAFERVEFKTDMLNLQARKGLKGIGATEEGVLRSHTLMPRQRRRDTVYYSILKQEWPGIKASIFTDYL
jgi:RimJ/RimL family protein N-acetyltransferase